MTGCDLSLPQQVQRSAVQLRQSKQVRHRRPIKTYGICCLLMREIEVFN